MPSAARAAEHEIVLPVAVDRLDDMHWSDTWGAARSGGRSHIGVDMMGPKMIPVRAAADAVVDWGRFSNSRGTIVRLRADDGWEYQYIHLNNDTPGTDDGQASCLQALSAKLCDSLESDGDLRKGTWVAAGEVIGYVGDSGNAEWTGSHLHFEMYQPVGGGSVAAVNPTPYVDDAAARARSGEDDGGTGQEDPLAAALAELAKNPSTGQIDRLYLAFFGRPADERGLAYWVDRHQRGSTLEAIAEWFAEGAEFERRYGHLAFGDFLDQLYREVLGREPDEEGKSYWLQRLEAGRVTRGTIVVYFTEGDELRRRWSARSELVVLARIFGHGVPSAGDLGRWETFRSTHDLETATELWFLGESPML